MEGQTRKVNPIEKMEFRRKEFLSENDKLWQTEKDKNEQDTSADYEKEAEIQNRKVMGEGEKKENKIDKEHVTKKTNVNEVKQYMEGTSQSKFYRLKSIMDKDTDAAIEYLAALSKKSYKGTKRKAKERYDQVMGDMEEYK